MNQSAWDRAITELERASARLMAALPANTPLIEDALERRAEAIRKIQSLPSPPDTELLARLEIAVKIGTAAQQQLLLVREQIRDGIARLNQASYLSQAFTGKPTGVPRAFDCEG
jgi:hypothetical protein